MSVNQTDAKAILEKVLSIDTRVWAISVIEGNGRFWQPNLRHHSKETFGVDQDGVKYGGTLAAATLSVVSEVKGIFGEAQIIITIHNNCKLMLLNIPSYEILIGLALERSFNCEDDNFIEKIKQLIVSDVQKTQE